ncbi:unnamed protein product [Brachionus calyciflorus]|uniref:Uncharacterized protein n=1 Tax=Brachionus calyciflorus TaxID=104777 RepID=A0A813Z643_9BILA|nr:unnamed protein product [Brachionus calyciflorus]
MDKLFGWQPAFQTDAVAEFYNRRQLPGEGYRDFYTNLWHLAKFAFSFRGEFDQISNDFLVKDRFVEQRYARLDLFKRNQEDNNRLIDNNESRQIHNSYRKFPVQQHFRVQQLKPYRQQDTLLLVINELLDETNESNQKKQNKHGEKFNYFKCAVTVSYQAENDTSIINDKKLSDFRQSETEKSERAGHARSVKFEQNSDKNEKCYKVS